MTGRFLGIGAVALFAVGAWVPTPADAQVVVGVVKGHNHRGPGWYGGTGPYDWNYPGLYGGPYLTRGYPFVGWPGYIGWPGFVGAYGSFWTNGLSLYGPPVPVYGPIPGVFGNQDLVQQWRARPTLGLGFGYVGWVGPYAASPRPKYLSVNPMPTMESIPAANPGIGAPAVSGGSCMYLSVKVPQPAAEVYLDGVRTVQTGTDRLFESPPLEPGKDYQYELTARWIERGVTVERKKIVTGKPGEVVRVDFLAPDVVVPTGK